MSERLANTLYQRYLKMFTRALRHNGITGEDEIARVMRGCLKKKFLGVFAQDETPKKFKKGDVWIANTEPRISGGEHWVAFGALSKSHVMIYDSFGRDLGKRYGLSYENTDRDAEQVIQEDNCGQRCCAWLVLFDESPTLAKYI